MVLPSPTELAELMGIALVPGPSVLKKPTPEEIERVRNVHSELCHETSDTFNRFASQFCAAYLPSLVQTLLIMPMSLEGPPATWWELHLDLLDIASHARTSGYLQRFVRESETDALKLYVVVLESLGGFGLLRPDVLETRLPTVRALLYLWQKLLLSIPQELPSLDELPRLSRQTLDGLTKFLVALPHARPETCLLTGERETLDTMVSSLLKYPERFYEVCRYCSKEHQKKDWKEHKKICFETKW